MTLKNGLPCKKCGTSDWYKSGGCKKCERDHKRQWKRDNPDKTAESKRLYRQANKDKVAEYARNWRQENRDKIAEYDRRHRQSNPDKVAEINRLWRKGNPEKRVASTQRRRTRETQAGGSFTAEEFKALCNHYGNKCLRCGRTDVKLTFDHILPVSKGGSSDISNGQPLCGRCNTAKKDRYIDYRPDAGPLRWLQAKLFG